MRLVMKLTSSLDFGLDVACLDIDHHCTQHNLDFSNLNKLYFLRTASKMISEDVLRTFQSSMVRNLHTILYLTVMELFYLSVRAHHINRVL